jgi:trk system potassium uptake protein TrkA
MYVIVVGAGAIGSQVIDVLSGGGHEIVVVERDQELAERIGREHDMLMLNADATKKDTLADAGIERADAVISTTDEDATNIMVLLLAQEFDVASLVTVVQNPEHMDLFRRIGANALENPQKLIAEYLVRAVERPAIKDFMTLAGDAEIFEVIVTEDAPIAEKTIIEADEENLIGEDVLVVAIERGDEVITPKGNTVIHAGDLVTVFSREGVTQRVVNEFAP